MLATIRAAKPAGHRPVPPASACPSTCSLPRGASTDPITWMRFGTAPVTGLVIASIPMTTSTSSAPPSPSPPTTSDPVCTETFAPPGTYTVAATRAVGIAA